MNQIEHLTDETVHIHYWDLHASLPDEASHLGLLSREECDRAQRFHFLNHRAHYILAHANMRRILSCYCDYPAEQLKFGSDVFGKPYLANPVTDIHFNLSHTEGLCAIAIQSKKPLGIDIERIRPIENEVAKMHFSAVELHSLQLLNGEAWLNGFYRCWTSKEAILKAEGVGLHIPLDSFDVQVRPDAPPCLIRARDGARFHHAWQLHQLDLCPEVAGTLATSGEAKVSVFKFD